MKKIEAFIRQHKLEEVREGLQQSGFNAFTFLDVSAYSGQEGQTVVYRGAEYSIASNPKLKVEVICPDDSVEKAASILMKHTRAGSIGDGKVFITQIEEAVRVRMKETGEPAA